MCRGGGGLRGPMALGGLGTNCNLGYRFTCLAAKELKSS